MESEITPRTRRKHRFLKWLVIVFALVVVPPSAWFAYQMAGYYREIKSGNTLNTKDRRFMASLSKTIANANVTKDDLARLTPTGLAAEQGAKTARVTVIAFMDYQCPFSKEISEPLRRVMANMGDRVRLFIRDYPIPELHKDAKASALAANCVLEQGQDAYWKFYDLLFTDQSKMSPDDLRSKARLAGADAAKYDECVNEGRYVSKIEDDVGVAIRTGVQGTPTFFVNGVKFQGAMDERTLTNILTAFLDKLPQ